MAMISKRAKAAEFTVCIAVVLATGCQEQPKQPSPAELAQTFVSRMDRSGKALACLKALGGEGVDALIRAVRPEDAPERRNTVMYATSQMDPAVVEERLIHFVNGEEANPRRIALWLLVPRPRPQSLKDRLLQLTESETREERYLSLLCLSTFAAEPDVKHKLKASLDSNNDLYQQLGAAVALATIHDASGIPALQRELKNNDPAIRIQCVMAFGSLGTVPASIRAQLKQVSLKDADPMVREYASSALQRIDDANK